jgi:sulfite oxidase
MIERSAHPLNAETPRDVLRASFVTPVDEFYIRSHGEIPRLTEAGHRIRVEGRVSTPLDLSIADLRARYPMRSVSAVMQCAGNRRSELHAVRPVSGDKWASGAIGNGVWTGVRLADVLTAAGAPEDASLHVAFLAADEIRLDNESPFHYGVSIPMAKAMAPEVLLALAMNDEPLRPEHGFPVRVVVPGFAGVRSPKWITAITVQGAR